MAASNNTVITSSPREEQIRTARDQLPLLFDKLTKYKEYSAKNPEVQEFQTAYLNTKAQLAKMLTSLRLLQEELRSNLRNTESEVRELEKQLAAERSQFGNVFERHMSLRDNKAGSEQMISDTQRQYNVQYIKNAELIVGVVLMIGMVLNCSQD